MTTIVTQLPLLAPASAVWVECRVCGLASALPTSWAARLCHACRCDLVMTRMAVECGVETVEARWEAAIEHWDILLEGASAETRERWERVEAARGSPHFAEAWARRKAEGGEFSALLEARDTLDALSDEVQAWRVWAERARAEIYLAGLDYDPARVRDACR